MVKVHPGSLFCLLVLAPWLQGQEASSKQDRSLGDLSLEELGSIDISSVQKRPEVLSRAMASVFVITREDIRRSGATTLVEVLRLAPNLQVAQIDASQFAIGARGLNTSSVNKLLVLIDGRTVFSPLHAAVFWDVQETLLEDIERIEVISGPGGTLWGSNAVNGVINILTRHSRHTQSSWVSGGAGDQGGRLLQGQAGWTPFGGASIRIYGKAQDHGPTRDPDGRSKEDAWSRAQAGFRMDWSRGQNALTLQGDAYLAKAGQVGKEDKRLDGANLLGRWERSFHGGSSLNIQVYVDHTHRDHPGLFGESLTTLDLDVSHHFQAGERHDLVWGGGYRSTRDQVATSPPIAFLPPRKELRLANLFAQDTLTLLPGRVQLALGAKLEHNVYTGWEFQPTAKLGITPAEGQLAWASVSRAVRIPSRLDREFYLDYPPVLVLNGAPDFRSEVLVAYELGYRVQVTPRFWLSGSPFYHDYSRLRTLEVARETLGNQMDGHAYGMELWGEVMVADTWVLKPGYAFLRTQFTLKPGSSDPNGPAGAGNDARHRFLLTSRWNASDAVECDGTLRYVSALPDPAVPAYWALDFRLAWRWHRRFELSLAGRNWLSAGHPEFGPPQARSEVQRETTLRATWTF